MDCIMDCMLCSSEVFRICMLQRLIRTINSYTWYLTNIASAVPSAEFHLILLDKTYNFRTRFWRPLSCTKPPVDTALLNGRFLSASTVKGTIPTTSKVVDVSVIRNNVYVKSKLVVVEVAEGKIDVGPKPCDVAVIMVSIYLGRRTLGAVVLNEFKATKGMSTPLNVAVKIIPKDVKVTVSRLMDVTRLNSDLIISMFPTKLSIYKPGLIAKIMLSSQWSTGSI
jgi:hypothetical protein